MTMRLIFGILIVLFTFGLFFDITFDGGRKLNTGQAIVLTVFLYMLFGLMFIIPYRLLFGG